MTVGRYSGVAYNTNIANPERFDDNNCEQCPDGAFSKDNDGTKIGNEQFEKLTCLPGDSRVCPPLPAMPTPAPTAPPTPTTFCGCTCSCVGTLCAPIADAYRADCATRIDALGLGGPGSDCRGVERDMSGKCTDPDWCNMDVQGGKVISDPAPAGSADFSGCSGTTSFDGPPAAAPTAGNEFSAAPAAARGSAVVAAALALAATCALLR